MKKQMRCDTCVHWVRDENLTEHLVHYLGSCATFLGLKVGLLCSDGNYNVDAVITEPDFFCATHKRKKKSSKNSFTFPVNQGIQKSQSIPTPPQRPELQVSNESYDPPLKPQVFLKNL